MKKLTLFLLTLIISCSAWAVPEKLYLTPSANWNQSGARFAAYFFGNGEKWISMTKVEGETNLYEVSVPSGYPSVIFCRMNPSASANNWNNKWNQTSDLTIPTNGTNHYTVKEGTWDKGGGTWSTYAPEAPKTYKDITITITATSQPKIHYWEGGDKMIGSDWNAKPDMVATGVTNTYSYTINQVDAAIGVYYLIVVGDIQTPDLHTTENVTANFKDLLPQVVVMGVNNWDGTDKMTVSDDYKTATITLNLTAKDYAWKLTIGGEWKGASYSIKRTSNSVVVAENGDNCTLTADKEGDYTFTYTYSTQKLVVDYPKLTITVKANDSNWGTVSGGGDFNYNDETTIKADAKEGYHFDKWNDNNKNESRTIKVTKDATYTATFAINTYTVTVNYGEGGKVSGGGTYNHGTNATIEAIPNDGYEFVKWNDGNTDNPRTITNITSKQSYTATFSRKDRTFSNPSTLKVGTYGKLTYQLPMPNNQWYWISLPFDVNVTEITVDGATNGVKNSAALVITEYNAVARAAGEKGWTNINSNILKANKGYVMGPTDDAYNANMVVNFPSETTTNAVNASVKNTLTSTDGDAQNANWYIIGTGLYHQGSLSNINYVAMPDNDGDYTYHYISTPIEDFKQLKSFAPFTAFFVQYSGDYIATDDNAQSAALAPIARAKAQQNEQIYLINMNEAHTVVILNAEGSEGYTAGEDFLEMNASNHSDLIYSFDGTDALAFNHRATEAQSINLGGYVATAGEQIISLNGYNANVESVTLVDNVTGETADLLAGDYTFNAEVGSLDGRFTVVFGAPKAGDTTVDCYNSTANQLIAYGSANACTVSGLTTGEAVVVYNAMGQLVFATIADSETITLPSLTTGNYLILHNGTTNKVLLK